MCRISSKPLPFTTIGTTLLHPKNTSSIISSPISSSCVRTQTPLPSSPSSSPQSNIKYKDNYSAKERSKDVKNTPSTDSTSSTTSSTIHLPYSDRVYQTAIIEPYDSQSLEYIFRHTDGNYNNTKNTYHCVTKLPLLSLPSLIEHEYNDTPSIYIDESKYNDDSCSNDIENDTTINHTTMDNTNTIITNSTSNLYHNIDQFVYETPPSSPTSKSRLDSSYNIRLSPPPPPDHYHHTTIIDISTLYHNNKNNPFDIYLPLCNDEQNNTTTTIDAANQHPNFHLFLPMVL